MLSPLDLLELPKNIIFRFWKPLQQIVCVSVCLAISLRWHISTFWLLCVSVTLTLEIQIFILCLRCSFCATPPKFMLYSPELFIYHMCVHVLYVVQRLSYSQATAGMSQPQLSAHYHGLPRRPSIPADQTPVPHPTACREQQLNPPLQPHSTPCQADLWWVTEQAWERIKRLWSFNLKRSADPRAVRTWFYHALHHLFE